MRRRATAVLAAFLIGLAAPGGSAADKAPASSYRLNPTLMDLPRGRWVKIHQQQSNDAVKFIRQKHGGSAFDTRRGRIVLFGSDTHAKDDWTNSPLFFDLRRLEWQRLYADDDPATYSVTTGGLAVAGRNGTRPWAMHTFGAVTYDPATDSIVVASYPAHMVPGRFTNALENLWPKVTRHPTWVLHLTSGEWEPLAAEPVHFFPYATAYDKDRGLVMGYRGNGVYELSPATGRWRQVTRRGLLGWGNNAAYDSRNRALVVFGSHDGRNDVVVYEPATGRHRIMPTPGPRPLGRAYVPMAYHTGTGKIVAVIDRALEDGTRERRRMRAETWLYDLTGDAWARLEEADLPFGVGMNYNLEFDPAHRLLLLVADPPDEPVAVWALRL
jgi:hypothetical protein